MLPLSAVRRRQPAHRRAGRAAGDAGRAAATILPDCCTTPTRMCACSLAIWCAACRGAKRPRCCAHCWSTRAGSQCLRRRGRCAGRDRRPPQRCRPCARCARGFADDRFWFRHQGRHRAHRRPARRAPVTESATLTRRNSAGCATFSIGGPAWSSPRPSATTSSAGSTNAWSQRARHRSPAISRALRSDAQARVEQFINAFTVNETYFYREDHQLQCLTHRSAGASGWTAQANRRADPHLVAPVLDRRGALFDRDVAAGELAAGRRLRHRDRRLGYRHPGAGSRAPGRVRQARADAAFAGPDRQVFRRRWTRSAGRSSTICASRCSSRRSISSSPRDAAARPVRCHLLPQRADLFR